MKKMSVYECSVWRDERHIMKRNPCPKCGSRDILFTYGQLDSDKKGYFILCRDCGYWEEDCNKEIAIKKWNAGGI